MLRSQGFFCDMVGLTISAVKPEAMVFSRKHHIPDVTLWLNGRSLSQTKEFKYLGVRCFVIVVITITIIIN
jgi:hypothetical protein